MIVEKKKKKIPYGLNSYSDILFDLFIIYKTLAWLIGELSSAT